MSEITPKDARAIVEAWHWVGYPDFAVKMDAVVSAWEADQESLALSEYTRDGLGDVVVRLEARIKELEERLEQRVGGDLMTLNELLELARSGSITNDDGLVVWCNK